MRNATRLIRFINWKGQGSTQMGFPSGPKDPMKATSHSPLPSPTNNVQNVVGIGLRPTQRDLYPNQLVSPFLFSPILVLGQVAKPSSSSSVQLTIKLQLSHHQKSLSNDDDDTMDGYAQRRWWKTHLSPVLSSLRCSNEGIDDDAYLDVVITFCFLIRLITGLHRIGPIFEAYLPANWKRVYRDDEGDQRPR